MADDVVVTDDPTIAVADEAPAPEVVGEADAAPTEPVADENPDPDWLSREQAEANIRARLRQVQPDPDDPDGKPYGHNWYEVETQRSRAAARSIGVDEETFLAAVAATSPGTPWDTKSGKRPNLAAVLALAKAVEDHPDAMPDEVVAWCKLDAMPGEKPQGYNKNLEKAVRILYGEDPKRVLGNIKTGHFFANLLHPERHANDPTIDRWAIRIMLGMPGSNKRGYYQHDKESSWFGTPKGYAWAMDRYRTVASEIGISAMAAQGATWVNIREEAGQPWIRK